MLHDRHRTGLRHLPPARRWAGYSQGDVIHLPAARVCGGWGAGWCDWRKWEVTAVSGNHEFIHVRSFADRRIIKTVHRFMADRFAEM